MRLAAALAFALVAAPAVAQPDPFVRPLPPAAAGTEVLGRYLRELGFEPKALSPDVYQVTIERDRWPVHAMLSLSTDGRRIWLESKFAPVEDPDRVPPAAWKRLLEANEKIGPAHFAFDKADRRIHLYKSFDNQALTPDRLRRELDHFDTTVRKTQDYWRAENFKPVIGSTDPPVPTPAIPPSVPVAKTVPAVPVSREVGDAERLAAAWEVTEIHVKGRKTPDEVMKDRKASLRFRSGPAGTLTAELRTGPDAPRTVRVVLDPDRPAKHIDFVDDRDVSEVGIYKLDGDVLTMCFAAPGEPRPVAFTTNEQSKNWVIVLKRVK
jgi:uncharacterized protein (TIGR03067 family)